MNEQTALQALTHLSGCSEEQFRLSEDHGDKGFIFVHENGTDYFVEPESLFAKIEPEIITKVKVIGTHAGLTVYCNLDDSIEIVHDAGRYSVIKLYANEIGDNGNFYYGDIFSTKEELLQKHPNCIVMEGFGVYDHITGFLPDDSSDWYESIDLALEYIQDECRSNDQSDNTQVRRTLPPIVVRDEQGFIRLLGSETGECYDLVIDKVKMSDKAEARAYFREKGYDVPELIEVPSAKNQPGDQSLTDSRLVELWKELTDVPFDEDGDNLELHLACDWHVFLKGTWREDIWRWFDAYHSKGVAWLLGVNEDVPSETLN